MSKIDIMLILLTLILYCLCLRACIRMLKCRFVLKADEIESKD